MMINKIWQVPKSKFQVPTQATNFIGLAAASAMGLVYQVACVIGMEPCGCIFLVWMQNLIAVVYMDWWT